MSQDYDKILKENIEATVLPLAKKLLGIIPDEIEEIPDDLQRTKERKPDFLKKIKEKEDIYILHIEYQTADDTDMIGRMLEYLGMLYRNYNIQVRQYVFYLGEGLSKMENSLSFDKLTYSFNLLSLHSISYREFLDSDIPEEIILAILANFEDKSPEKVVEELVDKLDDLPEKGTLRMEKCVKQLEILSNLRNLQSIIIQQIHKNMALRYDIKKDLRYLQGKEEGKEEERARTKEQEVEKALRQGKLSIAEIAEILSVTEEFVLEIKTKLGL